MARTIYIDENGNISTGGDSVAKLLALSIFLPPLIVPLYIALVLCVNIYSLDWHLMFRVVAMIAAVVAEIALFAVLIIQLFKRLPLLVFTALCMLYVGLSYGYVGYSMGLDKTWASGLIVFTASLVYSVLYYSPDGEGIWYSYGMKVLKFVGANALVVAVFLVTGDGVVDASSGPKSSAAAQATAVAKPSGDAAQATTGQHPAAKPATKHRKKRTRQAVPPSGDE